jgi:peptidoglycan/LPS O-acetylase OafA/YrhL
MAWLIFLSILSENIFSAENCEKKLIHIIKTDLIPRTFTFREKGEGLDYLKDYPECLSANGTYATFSWLLYSLPATNYGFCLPVECDSSEKKEIIKVLSSKYDLPEKIQSSGFSLNLIDLSKTKPKPKVAIFFFISFLILVSLEVLGTFYSLFGKENHLLSEFSIIVNFRNLFRNGNQTENLGILDGIRSLASMTIIFFHAFFFEQFFALSNRFEYNKLYKSLYFTFMISLNHSVDIFFFLSGFLMSFLTLKELQSKGSRFSWATFFLRRVIRYAPLFYFMIGLERNTYGGNPPSSHLVITEAVNSDLEGSWWSAMLFVHNLLPVEKGAYLGWTWTVAVDFQFFVACSLVMLAYFRNKTWGYVLVAGYVSFSVVYTTALGVTYGLSPDPVQILLNFKHSNKVYIRPIPRIPAYIIGVVLGFVYLKATQKKGKISQAYSVKDSWGEKFENIIISLVNSPNSRMMFYLIGFLFLAFSAFGPYLLVIYGEEKFGIYINSFWLAIQRIIFILGFSFFAFPLLFGHLAFVGSFLKLRIFSFVAKISYTMYLMNPLILVVRFMMGNEMHQASWQSVRDQFVELLIITLALSVILQVLIESPFLNLARRFLNR